MCGYCDILNIDKEVDPPTPFDENDFNRFANDVWIGAINNQVLPEGIYLKTAKYLRDGIDLAPVVDEVLTADLTNNIYIFSGAKTYQQTRTMTAMLADPELKSNFYKFKEAVKPMFKLYNEDYLQAEYQTAKASARMASDWKRIEADADVLPLLQYQTVGDGRVRPTHQALDNIIRPINDPFWKQYYPPNGWRCYDEKTSIYTNNGWKLFNELEQTDLVYTLNTETLQPEWQQPINYIAYPHDGKMIEFKANNFSCVVTEGHKMLVRKSWDRHKKRKTLKLIDAESVAISDQVYKSTEWKGNGKAFIKIAGKNIRTEQFAKFMGWYLSEGSTTKRSENAYAIKISQSEKKHLVLIWDDLKDFPFTPYLAKDYIGISSKELGLYLSQFGKSYEKFIPNEIKALDKCYLDLFLDRYVKGDGNITASKIMESGYMRKENICIHTSSKKMCDDLTEVIIKSHKSCTIRKVPTKGKVTKHRNGSYAANHDMYRINILHSNYYNIQSNHVNEIDYYGMVYCVEVLKHNTLLVMRDGKIYWCGNCRCTVIQLSEGELSDMSNFTPPDDVPPLFRMNAGIDGYVFKERGKGKHPYFDIAKGDKEAAKKNWNLPIPT